MTRKCVSQCWVRATSSKTGWHAIVAVESTCHRTGAATPNQPGMAAGSNRCTRAVVATTTFPRPMGRLTSTISSSIRVPIASLLWAKKEDARGADVARNQSDGKLFRDVIHAAQSQRETQRRSRILSMLGVNADRMRGNASKTPRLRFGDQWHDA